LTISERLRASAVAQGDAEALAVSDLLGASARPENIFHAQDLHNSDGVLFDGYGSLTSPSSRLDPSYMSSSSRRARVRAREALARVKPQSGEHLRLLTITMPTLKSVSFAKALEVFDCAMVLLRKRKWFKETIRGAVQGIEFTLGEGAEGYHVHAHTLAWSRWVKWDEFGEQVTDCLLRAAAQLGVQMNINTSHGRAVVDVRLVTDKRRGKGTVSIADAVMETCKYIVKGSDFEKIPAAELCEVERVLFGRRMVETFGECNSRRGKSDNGSKRPYLDKQHTVDGGMVADVEAQAPKRERNRSLREVGAAMIRAGDRVLWLELLDEKLRQRREWRKLQLSWRFPFATFTSLSGQVWHGHKVNRPLAMLAAA
jgi:hypothetical protein